MPIDQEGLITARQAPWWLKAVDKYGVTAVAFGFMLYFFLYKFDSKLDSIDASLQAHQTASMKIVEHLTEETNQAWATLAVMQRICLNTARSQDDRVSCASVIVRTVANDK